MNIEIIPNWHPIFVHFSIGLLGISTLFYLGGLIFKRPHLLTVARWNLYAGALITVATVLAGLYAYSTVTHDGPSHAAMTDHRNWALFTAATFILLALWSGWKQREAITVSPVFVVAILSASVLLAITGYKGAEAVYRHGIGVMRLPEIHGDGGHTSHTHGDMTPHHETTENENSENHDHSAHNHEP